MAKNNGILADINTKAYNRSLQVIGLHNQNNIRILQSAINNASLYTDQLNRLLAKIMESEVQLKRQIFVNQSVVDNIDKEPPYIFPTSILEI